MANSRQTVPMIFQVRSSLASFLRSSFSSRSAFSLAGVDLVFGAVRGFSGGVSFFSKGFSSFSVLDFFSLLAIETKIIFRWGNADARAASKQNILYLRITAIKSRIQPMI